MPPARPGGKVGGKTVAALLTKDVSLRRGLGHGELGGALGAIAGAHDLIPELIVAGASPQVMERVLDIGA